MRLASLYVALVTLLPNALAAQVRCGVERWPVKIWTDRDATLVDTVPIRTTVSALIRIPRPDVTPWPNSNRVAEERKTWVVRAIMEEVRSQANDSDWHVILRDPDVPGAVVIAEIPDSNCVVNDPRKGSLYQEARRALRTVQRNGLVEITGIAFFDTYHGQRHYAPNGIELHPVLRLTPLDSPTRQPDGAMAAPVPSDSVWVNTSSRVYHCPGTEWFGRTVRGYFTTEQEAEKAGARPAAGRRCTPRQ